MCEVKVESRTRVEEHGRTVLYEKIYRGVPTQGGGLRLLAYYPDVVSVKQMCIMLGGISMKTAYKLLGDGEIHHLKIGKSFKIPKICVIEYLLG